MDMEVLEKYSDFIVTGTLTKVESLVNLTSEELEVYEYLSSNNLRLEQERISQINLINTLSNQFD